MSMRQMTKALCVLAMTMWAGLPAMADEAGVKIGKLTISSVPGSGKNLIIRSSSDVEAVFEDLNGKEEFYIGEAGIEFGIDLAMKEGEWNQVYLVFSPAEDYRTGSYALQGKYFGTRAGAGVGVGVNAQVLLGGLDKSFSLQPLSVGTGTGTGVEAGLGYLFLQKDPAR